MKKSPLSLKIATSCTLLLASAIMVSTSSSADTPKKKVAQAPIDKPFSLSCGEAKGSALNKKKSKKMRAQEDNIRRSAQKGLNFLTEATLTWQTQNKCMGCHVQGVTAEALSVGKHHQYEVDDKQMKDVFRGILDLSGGVRTEIGHASPGGSLRASTRAFGGASLARYDKHIDQVYSDDMLNAATDLLKHQGAGGEITRAYNHGIAKGPLQGTYQAIQTWQQSYARSADDRWLAAVAKGEGYIQKTIDAWHNTPPADMQHINYAMLGLMAAGVGSSEDVVLDLKVKLLAQQNKDGGFPATIGQKSSSALVTGQTLYTLRHLGMNDSDPEIKRATNYLMQKQQPDGGWSDSGAEKAEAMWAVLGLVSTDVLSVNIDGVKNGQHIQGLIKLKASAQDNEGGRVKRVDIAIDDILVTGTCTARTQHTIDTSKLKTGMHTIDVTAYNFKGKKARRRLLVFAGDHYLTNLSTKYAQGGTMVSMRDIAPDSMKHNVKIDILNLNKKRLHTLKQQGAQGPLAFHWKGELQGKKKPAVRGEYIARVMFEDAKGNVRQTKDLRFVHDTPEVQASKYSQVTGRISGAGNNEDLQNATVELVDEKGNVVQSVQTTSAGNYRFRNLKAKRRYKVRVKKKGKKAREAEVEAAPASKSVSADFAL